MSKTIDEFHAKLAPEDRAICDRLRGLLDAGLPGAEAKIWHAHPVWFLSGNPIAGYGRLKDAVRLMFWSGQSFETPGLKKTGTFKAAERRFRTVADLEGLPWEAWLEEAQRIQWDYKNIVKRKGRLERL